MKLKLKRVNQEDLIKAQNELPVDNTRVHVRTKVEPTPLSREQRQNFKIYGSWHRPEVKQTYLSQGKKKTEAEQKSSDKKLAEQENRENYQKRKEKEAKDLEQALVVAPYVIPGLGQVMWLGKAVDVATIGASKGKYESWGDMVDKKTGSGEFIGDLTNPGYYAGAFPKLIGRGIKSTSKYTLQKAEPYLMGDKSIPMMSGYKPKMNFAQYTKGKGTLQEALLQSGVTSKNEEALKFLQEHYPKVSKFKGNIKNDDEVKNFIVKQINKNMTVARGVRPYGDGTYDKLHEIAGKVPPNTGAGRMYIPLNRDAVYTTNSIHQAAGYANPGGKIFIMQPKLVEGKNNLDFVQKNTPSIFKEDIKNVYLNKDHILKEEIIDDYYLQQDLNKLKNYYDPSIYKQFDLTPSSKDFKFFKDIRKFTGTDDEFLKILKNEHNDRKMYNIKHSLEKSNKYSDVLNAINTKYSDHELYNILDAYYDEAISDKIVRNIRLGNLQEVTKLLRDFPSEYTTMYRVKKVPINGSNLSNQPSSQASIDFGLTFIPYNTVEYKLNPNSNRQMVRYDFDGNHSHYMPLGEIGEELYTVKKEIPIEEYLKKHNKTTRYHTGTYTKGLSNYKQGGRI